MIKTAINSFDFSTPVNKSEKSPSSPDSCNKHTTQRCRSALSTVTASIKRGIHVRWQSAAIPLFFKLIKWLTTGWMDWDIIWKRTHFFFFARLFIALWTVSSRKTYNRRLWRKKVLSERYPISGSWRTTLESNYLKLRASWGSSENQLSLAVS